jgi:hypothetical protein
VAGVPDGLRDETGRRGHHLLRIQPSGEDSALAPLEGAFRIPFRTEPGPWPAKWNIRLSPADRRGALDEDVAAGDDNAAYVEGFGCLLDRG